MAKTLCKGVKKDGTPCLGNGLPSYNGYCIAHAPADKTREWRSRGGKNSSTAARSDKRIPERLRGPIEALNQGLVDVREGKLDPAAFSAMCRAAKVMAELYRLADEEMEQIRSEETQAAAMEVVGGHVDLAILNAAAQISAEQNQYRSESLIEQGLATPEPGTTHDSDAPVGLVLTDTGRRRLGLQQLTSYTQEDIDKIKDVLMRPHIPRHLWTAALETLYKMRTAMEEAKAELARDPAPVRDAFTGHTLSEPPAGVKTGPVPAANPSKTKSAAKILQEQLQQVEKFTKIFEIRFEKELNEDPLDWISDESA